MAQDDIMMGPTRRYQTRARVKATEGSVSTSDVTNLPRRATKGTKAEALKGKGTVGATGATALVAAPVRTTRRTAAAAAAAAKSDTSLSSLGKRTSSIPVPTTRTTRSGRLAAGRKAAETKECEKSAVEVSRKGKKKVAFQDDKENLFPRSRKEAQLSNEFSGSSSGSANDHSASTTTSAAEQEERIQTHQPLNPLCVQPTRLASPVKSAHAARPGGSGGGLGVVPHLAPFSAPPKRPQRPRSIPSDDSADELSCPLTPGLLTSPARRPVAGTKHVTGTHQSKKAATSPASLLASPPKRPLCISKQTVLGPVELAPELVGLHSPPKRPMASLHHPHNGTKGKGGFGIPVNVLASPPKRASVRAGAPEEDLSLDELATPTYNLATPSKIPALRLAPGGRSGRPNGEDPVSVFRDRVAELDAEGDIEMGDAGNEVDVDEELSPTIALHRPHARPGSRGLSADEDMHNVTDKSKSRKGAQNPGPMKLRDVAPLVPGLQGLGLESSRRVLFPVSHGTPAHSLESAAPIPNLLPHTKSKINVLGEIPIDPMLLDQYIDDEDIDGEYEEEDVGMENGVVYGPTVTTVPVRFGSEPACRCKSSSSCSPSQSNKATHNHILAGAVVFLDVKSTERTKEMIACLRTMGAKIVDQWDWEPSPALGGTSKVGITHVVFEGGSGRTLEKVGQSNGVVVCVGPDWVADCERRKQWVDEGMFSVEWECSVITTGPTSYDAAPIHYSPSGASTAQTSACSPQVPFYPDLPQLSNLPSEIPCAPAPKPFCTPQPYQQEGYGSANTLGFYTHVPAGEVGANPVLMERLMIARRKSMQFAPRIGSPLRRSVILSSE